MVSTIAPGSVFVSFSGESDSPIQNVYAVAPDGTVTKDVLVPPQAGFNELRGLRFAPDGSLFVANAHKSSSAIYVYDAQLGYTGISITPATSTGLLHPYELTFCGDGTQLLVSSQDTNVVTAFRAQAPVTNEPIASYLLENFGRGFLAGTRVASAVAITTNGFTPTTVPADQGGLCFDADAKHSVRGIITGADGKTLYVADEPGNRVVVLDALSGSYQGEITQSDNHSLQDPVGVALNPADGNIYIGSTGNNRIFMWDVAQQKLSVLIHDDDKLNKVSGIAFDGAGNLYTASRETCEIYHAAAGTTELSLLAGPFDDEPECLVVFPG